MNKLDICRICEEGTLTPRVGKNVVIYLGATGDIDCHYSECSVCGAQANGDQVRRNKQIMTEFMESVHSLSGTAP